MTEFLGEVGSSITSVLGDGIGGIIQTILYNTIYRLMYYIVVGICWLLQLVYDMLEVFAGLRKVTYEGNSSYLINVFFSNRAITNVYWGMALIGILCCISFTIYAISKKMFDLNGNMRTSIGGILSNMFKGILLIVSFSAIMVMVLSTTNILFESVNNMFANSQTEPGDSKITFNEEQYATMARIFNTIGNYSLSPSYTSMFNINSCYNDIRKDMYLLSQQKVFDYNYDSFWVPDGFDEEGNPKSTIKQFVSWQRSLKTIANAANLTQDLKMDAYNESVSTAITSVMNDLKKNPSFKPLASYERIYLPMKSMPIDRLLFLMGTLRAANNEEYNVSPSVTDSLRGGYYTGTKDMYDFDAVTADFDIGIAGYDYLVVIFAAIVLLRSFIDMLITFIQRIFHMLMLYLIAPTAIATMPTDEGEKFKQWTSAFVVQCLGVFGTVIIMHLFFLFMPIIFSADLILFENLLLNLIGKLFLLMGASVAAKTGHTIITGMLTGNSAGSSASVSDHSQEAERHTNTIGGIAKSAGVGTAKFAGKAAWAGAKPAVMLAGSGIAAAYRGVRNSIKSYGSSAATPPPMNASQTTDSDNTTPSSNQTTGLNNNSTTQNQTTGANNIPSNNHMTGLNNNSTTQNQTTGANNIPSNNHTTGLNNKSTTQNQTTGANSIPSSNQSTGLNNNSTTQNQSTGANNIPSSNQSTGANNIPSSNQSTGLNNNSTPQNQNNNLQGGNNTDTSQLPNNKISNNNSDTNNTKNETADVGSNNLNSKIQNKVPPPTKFKRQ